MIITTGNAVSLTTAEHRNQSASLLPPGMVPLAVRGGIHSGLGFSKTTGMSFRVAPGRAIVSPSTPSAGPYTVTVLDPETLTFDAGDTSRNRIDVVAIKVDENDTTDSPASVVIIKGSYPSSGNPQRPAVPAAHEPLFAVPISAGMTAGSGGFKANSEVDLRRQLAGIGSSIPVNSQAERDELLPYDGLTVMRLDLGGSIDRYVNGRWRGNTAMMFPTLNAGWAPMVGNDHPLWEVVRFRCRVVGDGSMLWLAGELKWNGAGDVREGMEIAKLPPSMGIKPIGGSWILATDDWYKGFCFLGIQNDGAITVGPNPTGRAYMFQGTVPLEYA